MLPASGKRPRSLSPWTSAPGRPPRPCGWAWPRCDAAWPRSVSVKSRSAFKPL